MASLMAVHLALRNQALTLPALPASRAWENERYVPTTGVAYVAESFVPQPPALRGLTQGGMVEHIGLYVLTWWGLANTGLDMIDTLDALLALYRPGSSLVATDGTVVRMRAEPAASRTAITPVDGWATSVVRIPWAFETFTP